MKSNQGWTILCKAFQTKAKKRVYLNNRWQPWFKVEYEYDVSANSKSFAKNASGWETRAQGEKLDENLEVKNVARDYPLKGEFHAIFLPSFLSSINFLLRDSVTRFFTLVFHQTSSPIPGRHALKGFQMFLNIGGVIWVCNWLPVYSLPGSRDSPAYSSPGSCDSPVYSSPGSWDSPVVNTPGSWPKLVNKRTF